MTWADSTGGSAHVPQRGASEDEVTSQTHGFDTTWSGKNGGVEAPERRQGMSGFVRREPVHWGEGLQEWLEEHVNLVDPDGMCAMGASAQAHGFLWVELPPPGPQYRGRLGLYIEETVEGHLERLGALPPGIHASTGLDASLSDQLYRARLLEKRGIALGIPSLEGIVNLGRVIDADDGAVLRWWIAAAADRPLRVVVSRRNLTLRVYPSPVLFESLFQVASEPPSPRPPCTSMAASASSMELSDLPPAVSDDGAAHAAETNEARSIADTDSPEGPVSFACTGVVQQGEESEREEEPTQEMQALTWPLGTEVAPVQDEYVAESGHLERTETGWLDEEVELPELDEALGLTVESGKASSAFVVPEETLTPTPEEASAEESEVRMLSNGASVAPSASTESSISQEAPTLVPPPSSESVSELGVDVSDERAETIEQEENGAAGSELAGRGLAAEERRAAGSELAGRELAAEERRAAGSELASPKFEALHRETFPPQATQDSPEEARLQPESLDAKEDASSEAPLDADEFLQALMQDSDQAPTVRERHGDSVETQLDESSSPTPLPTKEIKRPPFMKMADPQRAGEAVEGGERAAEDPEQWGSTPEEMIGAGPAEHDEPAHRLRSPKKAYEERATARREPGAPEESVEPGESAKPVAHRDGSTSSEPTLGESASSAPELASEPGESSSGEFQPAESAAEPSELSSGEPAESAAEPSELSSGEPVESALQNRESEVRQRAGLESVSNQSAPDPNDPFNQLAIREWVKWSQNLAVARGPKPLSVVERMFVTDYTRLREAVRRGIADSTAAEVLDEWRDSFSRSYTEAFDALRVRGKRPTMVLDLPELAQRLARLQGARRVQLLLIDGMRFDLGLMVQDRMRSQVEAALTERLLLWSALPTTTTYQLELLGRGPDGLKEPCDSEDSPALVTRGRAARTARRVRSGHLEIHKIDVVEDALRQPGRPVVERFGEIADDAAEAIRAHLEKQASRTLVMVFGDHGFSLNPRKAGTTEEVEQGGSSPEEVLVPAFAWLTGAVH